MTPLQFLSFRDRLDSASGFQSAGLPPDRGDARRRAIRPRRSPPSRRDPPRAGRSRPPRPGRRSGPRSSPTSASAATRCRSIRRRPGRRGPGGARRGLPRRPGCGAGRGTARRPRRGRPGVALPAREDGRADDRHEARDGRLERRRVPALHALPAGRSPTCGRSAPGSDRGRTPESQPTARLATSPAARGILSPRPQASPRTSPSRGPVTLSQGGAHEGRCRQGDRARRAARRPGTRSARQAQGGRAGDPRRDRRRRRLGLPRHRLRGGRRDHRLDRRAVPAGGRRPPGREAVRRRGRQAALRPGGRRLPRAAHRPDAREGPGRRRA